MWLFRKAHNYWFGSDGESAGKSEEDSVDYGIVLCYVQKVGYGLLNSLFDACTVEHVTELPGCKKSVITYKVRQRSGSSVLYRMITEERQSLYEDLVAQLDHTVDAKMLRLDETMCKLQYISSEKCIKKEETEQVGEDDVIFCIDSATLEEYRGPKLDYHENLGVSLTLGDLTATELFQNKAANSKLILAQTLSEKALFDPVFSIEFMDGETLILPATPETMRLKLCTLTSSYKRTLPSTL